MKAKKLISFITAAAVVASIGISYATWDKLSDSASSGAITIASATTVDISSDTLNFTGELAPAGAISGGELSAEMTVNINGKENLDSLKLSASDIKVDNIEAANNDITVTFLDGNAQDASEVPASGDVTLSEANVYTVKVTLDENADPADYAGKTITFEINAEATAKTI